MRRWIAALLAVCMLGCVPAALGEAGPETDALPRVGDVVYGFEAKEIREFGTYGATLTLFEHLETGAKLIYAANEDTNRAFQLTFLTRPLNDMGLPHVFEHATLYGSEKYPSKTLLFNMMYQTYNTYINAYTMDAMTSYPLASLSEAQLLKLADWYTDSCLHPNIMTDESIYRTQAWHYEMEDPESPLTLEGTVYSEMTGALTLEATALDNANRITFPGAALSFDYGGIPEHIPEMAWEDLKDYHNRYYVPSNCLALLYGSFEHYSDFLKMLDGAFAGYGKQEISREEAYQRISEPVVSEVPYPVEEGTDTANRSTIYYYIVLPELRNHPQDRALVDHLCQLLGSAGSPLTQNLKKALPTGSFSMGREVAAPDDAVVMTLQNVNREDAETFRSIVDSTLKEIAETGFDATLVEALATAIELKNRLASEDANPVETILLNLAYDYAVTGNPFEYVDQLDRAGHIQEENSQGLLQQAAKDWLLDPALYTLTTTYPAPGEKERQDAALAEKLAAVKAGMTEEEILAVVAATHAEPEEENNGEMIASLQALTIAGLPEEVRSYESRDYVGEDGARRIEVTAGVDGVGKAELFLDARTLPPEDIHYLRLFTRLLGKLDTDAHTREELSVLMSRYFHDGTLGVGVYRGADSSEVKPYLVAEWTALDEDLEEGYQLVKELLFHTSFANVERLTEQISAQKTTARSQINSAPYQMNLFRALGRGNMDNRYYDYLNFTEYYAFLDKLEQQMAEAPETVAEKLAAVQAFFANRAGAVAGFAGSRESIAVNRPLADAFLAELGYEEREIPALNLPEPAAAEGIIVDSNIGFNTLAADFGTLGMKADGSLDVICGIVADKILVPTLRDQMGVYTPLCSRYEDRGLYLVSYRDPNVKETFEVYRSLPEQIAALEISQEELDGYVMSSYSELAKPKGELTGAVAELERLMEGEEADKTLRLMQEMKQVTPESVRGAAELFRTLWEKGYKGTAAGAGAIQANADLYEAVLNPFSAVDAGEVTLADAGEDREDYEAIRFAFENGLMGLTGENTFSPDNAATAGDLYGALYVLIGGAPNAAEEALATFSQYGMVPEGVTADSELTFGLRDGIMNAFGAAAGMPLPAIGEGRETEVMTRAQLAQDLMIFGEEE